MLSTPRFNVSTLSQNCIHLLTPYTGLEPWSSPISAPMLIVNSEEFTRSPDFARLVNLVKYAKTAPIFSIGLSLSLTLQVPTWLTQLIFTPRSRLDSPFLLRCIPYPPLLYQPSHGIARRRWQSAWSLREGCNTIFEWGREIGEREGEECQGCRNWERSREWGCSRRGRRVFVPRSLSMVERNLLEVNYIIECQMVFQFLVRSLCFYIVLFLTSASYSRKTLFIQESIGTIIPLLSHRF